jgi:hypothetical protein
MGKVKELVTSRSEAIRLLNDLCRRTFTGAQIVVTAAFTGLEADLKARALERVRTFNDFDGDNDPHHEADFGSFEMDGHTFNWQFAYYDPSMKYGADHPEDPDQCRRVLTVGLREDW